MKTLTLYPGDNDGQEFFEDVNSIIALIRNYGDRNRLRDTPNQDKGWFVHGNGPNVPAWFEDKDAKSKPGVHTGVQGAIKDVIEKLEKQYEIKLIINLSKVWVHPSRRAKSMRLVDAEKKTGPCYRCGSEVTWHGHPKAVQSTVKCEHCGYIGFITPRLSYVS